MAGKHVARYVVMAQGKIEGKTVQWVAGVFPGVAAAKPWVALTKLVRASGDNAAIAERDVHQPDIDKGKAQVPAPTDSGWVAMVQQLATAFPALRLGAASVRSVADLEAALAAGLGYAVSPILDRALLERAAAAGITLVPGVFSPSEISQAVAWGAPAVKLFPAATLGPGYWSALAGPLAPLPFCIAAGGLAATDAAAWFRAGVNAVALGGSLFEAGPESAEAQLRPGLAELLAWVHQRLH